MRSKKGKCQRSVADQVWRIRVPGVPFKLGEPGQGSPDTGHSPLTQLTPDSSPAGPRSPFEKHGRLPSLHAMALLAPSCRVHAYLALPPIKALVTKGETVPTCGVWAFGVCVEG